MAERRGRPSFSSTEKRGDKGRKKGFGKAGKPGRDGDPAGGRSEPKGPRREGADADRTPWSSKRPAEPEAGSTAGLGWRDRTGKVHAPRSGSGAERGPKKFGRDDRAPRPFGGDRDRGPKKFGRDDRAPKPFGGDRDRGPKKFGRDDGAPRPFGGDRDRGPKKFGRDDRGPKPFGGDRDRDRGPKKFGRDDRGPKPFGRDDRGPKPFGGDRDRDRGPKKFGRDDRGPKPFGGDRERGPKKFGRDDRGPKPFGGDRERGPKKFGRDDRGPRPFGGDRGPKKFGRDDRGYRPGRRDEGEGREIKIPPRAVGPTTRKRAVFTKHFKGFGFMEFDDRQREDIFIPPRQASQFFHGDHVEIELDQDGEIVEVEVLSHRFRELVGTFESDVRRPLGRAGSDPDEAGPRRGWICYERKRAQERVRIVDVPDGLQDGHWLRAKLEFTENGEEIALAHVEEVYGETLPPSADLPMIAGEHSLVEAHSEAAVREAEAFKLDVEAELEAGREDFRRVPFLTIDGETARDFDDAIHVEKAEADRHILWVAIADVSHYVRPGTALDEEARDRGTSVYFPERAFHMLPRALSENLCSLRPNLPRLALIAKMKFDSRGKNLGTTIHEGIIQSRRRATYTEIQIEHDSRGTEPGWEFAEHFRLYSILRKARSARGSIDFEFPEPETKVEPTGEVISITRRPRLDAHRLIEEFMIAANEGVSSWALERGLPFVFRVHERPSTEAVQKFFDLAETQGVTISKPKDPEKAREVMETPQFFAKVVAKLTGHPAQELLHFALLRSMKQARYTAVHGGHFGLASDAYSHFTSPIRRYPDLLAHRQLRSALRKETARKTEDLEQDCEHCSYRERLATAAERDSLKLKQVRALAKHLGEEMDGKVTGLAEFGFFVQMNDPFAEGLVPLDSIDFDRFELDQAQMVLRGFRSRQVVRVGDLLRVRVDRADLMTRQVDLAWITGETGGFAINTRRHRHREENQKQAQPPGQKRKRKPGKGETP